MHHLMQMTYAHGAIIKPHVTGETDRTPVRAGIRQRCAVLKLELFSASVGEFKSYGNVIGYVFTANGNHTTVAQ